MGLFQADLFAATDAAGVRRALAPFRTGWEGAMA